MPGFGWLRRNRRPPDELSERDLVVWQVRLAEKARRFEDMASAVVLLVECVTTASNPLEQHHLQLPPLQHQRSQKQHQSDPTVKPQQTQQTQSDAQLPHALLTREERNLFAVAFKSVADRRRTALRGLELLRARLLREALETKTESTDRALLQKLDQLELMQLEVALELRSLCDGVIVRDCSAPLFFIALSLSLGFP